MAHRSLGLILLLVAAQHTIQGQEIRGRQRRQWKEYAYADDGFAISLPDRVDPHEDQTLSPATYRAFVVTRTYAYSLPLSHDVHLTLHVATFPKGCSDFFAQYQAMIRSVKDGGASAAARIGIQRDPSESLTETESSGYAAVETEHDKPDARYLDRMQCVANKLYVFTATWPPGAPRPPELTRVIDSLRFLTR